MKPFLFMRCLLVLLPFSACYTIQQTIDSYKSSELKTDASFMVVSANSSDQVRGLIEQQLLVQGFKVIADNYIRTSAPAGAVTISTADTTVNTMRYQPIGIEMFKAKDSDYVIRYEHNWRVRGSFFNYFSASVINTKTGMVEFTYNFREGNNGEAYKDLNFILRDFAVKLKAKG